MAIFPARTRFAFATSHPGEDFADPLFKALVLSASMLRMPATYAIMADHAIR